MNESSKPYLGNKEQKLLFLVISQSDVHTDFGFSRTFFACLKNQAHRSEFVQPCSGRATWNYAMSLLYYDILKS